ALGNELYRVMALQQALRAQRGSADALAPGWPALWVDVYLLLEAWAADAALIRMLPGMAGALARLRRHALERRPALASFASARRPLERLLRELLSSPVGQMPDGFVLSDSPAHSLVLVDVLLGRLGLSPDDRNLGQAPLLRDWWTGALQAPEAAAAAPPRSARLPRRPDVRTAQEDEDEGEEGLFMVQADEPHQHAEDPLGLNRPIDRDEDISADEYGDMLSELPEARLVATPGSPKEVLLSDDPPGTHTALQLKRAIAAGEGLDY